MRYEIQLKQIESRPTLSVRGRTTVADLPKTIGDFLQAVWARLERAGVRPTGPPFTRYHSAADLRDLEIEAGFTVPQPMAGEGDVQPGRLPGGEVIATDHFGRYEDLPDAGVALEAWMVANDRAAAGPNWEYYWSDPGAEADPAHWRTEVIKPLAPRN